MFTYLITTFDRNGNVRATIHLTCDEGDAEKAKALVTVDPNAQIDS